MYNNYELDITKYKLNDIFNVFNISKNLDDNELVNCKDTISALKLNNVNFFNH